MALKRIIVAASGGTASDGAIETACRIAKRVGAGLEAFHVKLDPAQIIGLAADGYNMPISGDWIEKMIADTDKLAETTKSAFAAAAGRHGLAVPGDASFRAETGYAPVLVAHRARYFDLVVLGRSERVVERPHTDTIEETLVRSGRPVLLAPASAPDKIGTRIAVGWNGSAEAVHAVTFALPLLEKAESVTVVTVGEAPDDDPTALMEYLKAHGVAATHRQVAPVAGVGAGEQVLAEARDADADLLVIGAYGHATWRELLFGGATRHVIGASLLPVLLAH
ncbi:MAG TPA: universal stress protein [Stellaceae bacterium]|nr:universal stress protein [Stellaceae bacterium]